MNIEIITAPSYAIFVLFIKIKKKMYDCKRGHSSLRRVFYYICGIWSRRPEPFFFLLSLLHLFFFRWPFLYGVFISLACNAFTCPMGYHKVLFRFSLSSLSFQTDCSVRHRCNRPGLKGQRRPFVPCPEFFFFLGKRAVSPWGVDGLPISMWSVLFSVSSTRASFLLKMSMSG